MHNVDYKPLDLKQGMDHNMHVVFHLFIREKQSVLNFRQPASYVFTHTYSTKTLVFLPGLHIYMLYCTLHSTWKTNNLMNYSSLLLTHVNRGGSLVYYINENVFNTHLCMHCGFVFQAGCDR